jgi:amino acid adenylation domain-containing protein
MESLNLNVLPGAFLDEQLAAEKAYWLDRLGGDLTVSGLPLDFKRPAVLQRRPETLRFAVAEETAREVLRLCGDNRSLAFAILVAAVEVCLHKYTGVEDIVIGTAIHEQHAEVAALNRVLALRDRVTPDLTVRALLGQVRRTLSEAFTHQKYPFDRLLELLEVPPARNRAPLFDVAVLLEEIHDRQNVRHLPADVTLVFSLVDGGLRGEIEYDASLFCRETLEVFATHLRLLLGDLVRRPDAAVADLRLLSDERTRELVETFNATGAPYPHELLVTRLFDEQAARTPDAPAVACGARVWSYRELAVTAHRLARRLRRRGIDPGQRVGVHLERSPELVASVLAIFQAGAVFVPLDPEQPAGRLGFIAADAGLSLLIARRGLPEVACGEYPVLQIDEEMETLEAEPSGPLGDSPGPEDAAYVIYTSGSTGQPKGVEIAHRSLINYLWWGREVYLGGEPLSFGLYTSIAFDLTVTSLLLPLITGGRVVVYPERVIDPTGIVEDGQVEVLKLTPSHLVLLQERSFPASRIRRIIVGGEAFEAGLAARIHEVFGGRVEIFNEYGPTEATVGCMIHRFHPAGDRRGFVPIGRPAANMRIYLLDTALRPVAENVAGEIYIAGDGVARGYLARPDLTASRFVPDPFDDGGRLYRTGDLARRLADGTLEFLGRVDDQIKFHGYRIELNEIRCALNRNSKVRDSVVVLARDGGHEVLVAYYAARQELDPDELRASLAESLIEAMIPSFFVHLKKLPLTLNGKINVRALPPLAEVRDRVKRPFLAPRTSTEETLAALWSRVLGVERIGLNDSFFDLGGHSLLATQVISRVREAFRVEIPLARLFEARLLGRFAEVVEEALRRAEPLAAGEPIRSVPRNGPLPLSFSQERLWFLDQLEPGTPAYNILTALRLSGDLRLAALEESLSGLVRRHESLRTVFRAEEGKPYQVILPPAPFALRRIDLSDRSEDAAHRELRRMMAQEGGASFDLANGPLVRGLVVRLAAEEHALLLTFHHIVSDGWSLGVFVREMRELYAAFVEGRAPELPELALQYADYAHWQRATLQGKILETQLAYWRGAMAGVPPLDLPTDRKRPAVQTSSGASLSRTFPPDLAAALGALGRREGATLFNLLLAGFEVLLHRLSGQDDFAVGTFIAGRNRAEIEPLIGFFINNLALRADLSGDPSFAALVRRTTQVTLGAYAHQEIPFERLLEDLAPVRDLSRTPLFQVMFVFQNMPLPSLELPGVRLAPLPLDTRRSNFDLTLWMYEIEEGLRASFHYNIDLFEEATVQKLLERLELVLRQAVGDPERRISELDLLDDVERRQVLEEWADGDPVPGEEGACVHELFAAQAERTPDAVAVLMGTEGMRYGELEDRANRLADELRRRGAGPESRIAVLLERSPDQIVALLGVLKAGAAYVPLDPSYPAERLELMLEDSGARLVVTRPALTRILDLGGSTAVDVGAASALGGPAPQPVRSAPGHLAYVIYTSGSTGRPKGVEIEHRSLASYVRTAAASFELGPSDRVLQFASISFDTAAEEIFPALASGATLVLRNEEMLASARAFVERCGALGVTVLDLPTAFWNQAVPEMEREGVRVPVSVRLVILGGERVLADRLARAWHEGSSVRLLNTYGPTEVTIVAASWEIPAVVDASREVPIGRPVAGARAYVLGRNLEALPSGVPGELCLGGAGVARGYLRRPELTAERFVPDPWSGASGARLYRSGDLARWRPDGLLEFLGRADHQVKIRGFRVEPGEVEAALAAHPAVRENVVGAGEDERGDRRLVAWVAGEATAATLREHLRVRLPEYMVPAAFVILPELPRLPNGKVDRKALPAPDAVAQRQAPYVAPRTEEEEMLVAIWAEVLQLRQVGIHDNFFDLGGHSLLAAQLVARVRKAVGVELPLRKIFEFPTVMDLALAIEEILIAELEELEEDEARRLAGMESLP